MRMSSPEDVPAMRPTMRGAALAEPVIATKLFVPALGTRSVQRPRLRNALEKARNARLTLVVAPAGWGKSTLLAQWLCDGGVPCGWLSLDAADDDVTRFWRYLLVAVQQADAGVGSAALRRLDPAGRVGGAGPAGPGRRGRGAGRAPRAGERVGRRRSGPAARAG